jgi:NAD(P)-dependent dehydrogenase (short-subunit alcohol dehydrogenase family)
VLENKVIIVTGGGSGMGRASAIMFGAVGARVLVADWSDEGGKSAVEEITKAGGNAIFLKTDVSKEEDVERMVKTAVDTYGRLDGAFNNAGLPTRAKLLPDLTSAEFDLVHGVNERGVFLCMKYEIAVMRHSGGGAIVNTSSCGGQMATSYGSEYFASKHAVIGLTRSGAAEAGITRVRVNSILPGMIVTPMIEQLSKDPNFQASLASSGNDDRHSIGRFGTPDDIANAAKWLLSDESAFINGVNLPVDGGFLAR